MPFIVDSVTMELGRQGYGIDLVIHPVVRVRRDDDGRLIDVLEPGAQDDGAIARVSHPRRGRARARQGRARRGCARTSSACSARCAWRSRTGRRCAPRPRSSYEELEREPPPVDPAEVAGGQGLPQVGLRAPLHVPRLPRVRPRRKRAKRPGCRPCPDSGLGILRNAPPTAFKRLRPKALELARAPHVLVLTKANSRSNVHRPAYLDYIGVKKFGPDGQVTGERRFLGLYTTAAYKASPRDIPLLAQKVEKVLNKAGFPPASHDRKALLEIIESYPRDSLFQMSADELFDVAMGILGLGERQRVRLFVRRDAAGPLRRVPGDDPARPLQHREPRAGRRDPARGVRRQPSRLDAAAVGVGARARAVHRALPGRRARALRRRRDRGAAGDGRRAHGPTTCARR